MGLRLGETVATRHIPVGVQNKERMCLFVLCFDRASVAIAFVSIVMRPLLRSMIRRLPS